MLEMFSKNKCQQCKFTKRRLDEHGIEYTVKMVDENEEYLNEFKNKYNGKKLPMLVKDGEVIAVGFMVDVIDGLKGE